MHDSPVVSERTLVLMKECDSEAEFVEQVTRWLKVASPKARYYIRLYRNKPQALVLGDGEIVPNSAKYQYVTARAWLICPS